jgi:hypothetical protein
LVCQRSSRLLEDHGKIPNPEDRLAWVVEVSFSQDRVVTALVEVDHDPFRLDFDYATRFHKFAIELFGGGGLETQNSTNRSTSPGASHRVRFALA